MPVPLNNIGPEDLKWMMPPPNSEKWYDGPEDALRKIAAGQWQLWRIQGDAKGVLMTYVLDRKLWICYLHGEGVGPTQVKRGAEILTRVVQRLGLDCVTGLVHNLALARIYLSLGAKVVEPMQVELGNG